MADDLGADYIATGHYANIRRDKGGTPFLVRGQDAKKDQSYFLYRIPPSWLSKMMFPLGEMEKSDVWREAEAMGLPVDELQESQEICFVTQGDYRQFLKQHAPQASIPGTFVDMKGKEQSILRQEWSVFFNYVLVTICMLPIVQHQPISSICLRLISPK